MYEFFMVIVCWALFFSYAGVLFECFWKKKEGVQLLIDKVALVIGFCIFSVFVGMQTYLWLMR